MHLYNISTDEKILDKLSRQYARVKEYLHIVDGLVFFVFTKNKSLEEIDSLIDGRSFKVVPVYGRNKLMQVLALFKLIKYEVVIVRDYRIKRHNILSPQDPFEIGLVSYILAKIFKMKLCVQMHTDISNQYFREESLRNIFQYYLSLFIFKRADSIRVVSKRMKEYLVKRLKINENKIHIIPVYVDVEKFKIASQQKIEKTVDLLMLSRVEPVKNIDLAIDAVHEINRKRTQLRQGFAGQAQMNRKNLNLKIVGDGSDKKRLQEKYKSEEYDFVSWADYTNKVEEEYVRAKVLIISSKYEGYAVTAIEAVASGLPVVMTPVGCANEFIISGKNGEISTTFEVKDYMEAVERCLENINANNYDLSLEQIQSSEELLAKYEDFLKA